MSSPSRWRTTLLVVAVLALLLAGATQAWAQGPQRGQILVSTWNGQLRALDPDTGGVTRSITTLTDVRDKYAVWAPPNRSRVLFWRTWKPFDPGSSSEEPTITSLMFRNANNPSPPMGGYVDYVPPFRLDHYQGWWGDAEGSAITMSPDGRYILYGANHPTNMADDSWLIAIDLARRVYPGGGSFFQYKTYIISKTSQHGYRYRSLKFTPDGQRIVLVESNGTHGRMKMITFAQHSQLLLTWPEDIVDGDLAYDGSRVAYELAGTKALWVGNGGNTRGRRSLALAGDRPRFSGLGTEAVYTVEIGGEAINRMTVPAAGPATSFLLAGAGSLVKPSW